MAPAPLLLHVFPTFVPAGAQVRTVQLMNALGAEFRHRVVGLDGRHDALDLIEEGVEVQPLELPPLPSGPLSGLRRARRALAGLRPDALLTYNWGSFDWALAGARSGSGPGHAHHLHHEDGFNADEAGGQKSRRVLARRLGLARSRLIIPSHQLEEIARTAWKLPRALLVPNGVHLDRFARRPELGAALREELGIPPTALVVGAVGHLRPVKNFPRLLRAVARLPRALEQPGVHLLVLGDGEERERLGALAAEHLPPGGRVHLAGHRSDLRPAYAAMDVLAISSDSEQLPVSLLEAMACEVAVAGTDVGDVGRVLPEGAAAGLVPLGQPGGEDGVVDGLAASLAELLESPERRSRAAAEGLERVRERYSFAAMLETYRAEYTRAVKGQ